MLRFFVYDLLYVSLSVPCMWLWLKKRKIGKIARAYWIDIFHMYWKGYIENLSVLVR